MDLIKQIVERAKANKQRIVLPEGTEERTLKAADRLLADEVVEVILIGNPDEIKALAEKHGLTNIDKATIIDPINNPRKEVYANLLFELRKSKGMTIEKATALAEDPLYLGTLIIKNGDADGDISPTSLAVTTFLEWVLSTQFALRQYSFCLPQPTSILSANFMV